MNARIRNLLIKLARTDQGPLTLRRLVIQAELGLDLEIRHEKQLIGTILDEVSMDEHKQKRPLLSALVRDKKTGQGDRFYKLCEELGMGDWKELKNTEGFKEEHIEACRQFWKEESNYKKYF